METYIKVHLWAYAKVVFCNKPVQFAVMKESRTKPHERLVNTSIIINNTGNYTDFVKVQAEWPSPQHQNHTMCG